MIGERETVDSLHHQKERATLTPLELNTHIREKKIDLIVGC